jgi:hypothetical protein
MEGRTSVRKPRSDGQRNRALIVQIARQCFRAEGINASLEAVA